MGVPYTKTKTSISLVINWVSQVIPHTHHNFDAICAAVEDPNTTEDDLIKLIDLNAGLRGVAGSDIQIVNGKLYFRGYECNDSLAQLITSFYKNGTPEAAAPFENFMLKVRANPDPRAAQGLFDWVVAGKLPITPQGDILAWKGVREDYYSIKSGKKGRLLHTVGSVVEEPRTDCDSNPNQTCSRGIHFASLEYIKNGHYVGGGSRIMAVAISPEDVVAFPNDYNLSKGRCCRLMVVGEVPRDQIATFYPNHGKLGQVYDGWNYKSPMPVGTSSGMAAVAGELGVAPAVPKAPRTDGNIAAGQVWTNRRGDRVTIASIDGGPAAYPVKDSTGNVYTTRGHFNSDRDVSQLDLVTLVTDVH